MVRVAAWAAPLTRWGWRLAAVGLAVLGQPLFWWGPSAHSAGYRPPDLAACILVCLVAAPLAAAEQWAVSGFAVSAVALVAYDVGRFPATPADLAPLALLVWVIATRPARVGVAGTAAFTTVIAAVSLHRPAGASAAAAVSQAAVVPAAALVGVAYRAFRARDELVRRGQALAFEEERLRAERALAAERLRIARELHDSVGHGITLTGLRAEAAARLVRRDPAHAERLLVEVGRCARDAMAELHQLVGFLRDSADPPAPVQRDIDSLVRRFSGPDLTVMVRTDTTCRHLPGSLEEPVSAIVAEGLANVVRHAGAHEASVNLYVEADSLVVEVADDGRGPNGAGFGFGLAGLAERARAAGGDIRVEPASGGGTLLRAALPWPAQR